jgi:hypothetical protein
VGATSGRTVLSVGDSFCLLGSSHRSRAGECGAFGGGGQGTKHASDRQLCLWTTAQQMAGFERVMQFAQLPPPPYPHPHPPTPQSLLTPLLFVSILPTQILNISAPLVVLDDSRAAADTTAASSSSNTAPGLSSIQLCLLDTPGPNEAGEEGLKYQVGVCCVAVMCCDMCTNTPGLERCFGWKGLKAGSTL